MNETDRTNGIIIIRKGAVLLKNGEWKTIINPTDVEDVLRRMKRAKSHGTKPKDLSEADIGLAYDTYSKVKYYYSAFHVHSYGIMFRHGVYQFYQQHRVMMESEGSRSLVVKGFKRSGIVSNCENNYSADIRRTFRLLNDVKYSEYEELDIISQDDEGTACKLHFMDFAGQSVFNSTHQMFMDNRAIYFLVFDISLDLETEVEDDDVYCLGANRRMSVEDFTEFLLNSIHVYSGDHAESFPKVLLIGTHKDKVDEVIARRRMETIKNKFQDTPLQKHIRGDFIVDGSIEDDSETDRLKQFIFEIVQQEPHWGKETPTRWLPLENSIITRRDQGHRVLTLQKIREINTECFVTLECNDEIQKFLKFHNLIGSLMYFGGTAADDIVILDPQWLIDGLKQIITHERFYLIPEGLENPWKDFTERAKLHKNLIEAVWSENEDKTFITHKKQLLAILQQTDIIASPLMYDQEGRVKNVDYYFVPTMLKPNEDGKEYVNSFLTHCSAKSPSLCFVFENNFMQPAIFPRIQAECTSIYRIKEVDHKPLLFYQVAVFQLNHELAFVLKQVGYVIKVIVFKENESNVNENESDINAEICENVRHVIEEALLKIVRLYGSKVPFQKKIQCESASADLDGLFTWQELEESKTVLCKAHTPKEWHRVKTMDAFGPWVSCMETNRTEPRLEKTAKGKQNRNLGSIHLARLARRLQPSELLLAIRTGLPEIDWQHSRLDNKDHIVGEVNEALIKWRNREGGLTLKTIHRAVKNSPSRLTLEQLIQAITDTDTSHYLKDFDQGFLESNVNDEALDLISQRSSKKYRHLALELGLDDDVINSTVKDIPGVTHRAKHLLGKWRENASSVTFREIGRAIIEVDMDILLLNDCEHMYLMKVDNDADWPSVSPPIKEKTHRRRKKRCVVM